MKVAVDDNEAIEGLQYEAATVLTRSIIGWGHTKHEAFLVDFADLAAYFEWSQQFYGVQTVEAWLDADNTPIPFLKTLVEPDYPD